MLQIIAMIPPTKGIKPITLGGITWAAIAISSFLFAILFKGYIESP